MTTFEQMKENELRNINLKYKEQCPYEKGHASFGFGFFWGFTFAVILSTWAFALYGYYWDQWGLRNDLAYYHASTGKLVWRNVK